LPPERTAETAIVGEGRRYAVIEDPAGAVAAIYEEKEGG